MLFSAACERNKEVILRVLEGWLPRGAQLLEIGSGSGQHAVHCCSRMPALHWQCSEPGPLLAELEDRLDQEGRPRLAPGAALPPAIRLDVSDAASWPQDPVDAVFTANTVHIMPSDHWPMLCALAAALLREGGALVVYGPFLEEETDTAPSNLAFDASLRQRDPAMGLRQLSWVTREAARCGLVLSARMPVPSNNLMLQFRLQR
ncbi:DUF938 domain-containing protein [Synechococcus sp. RSCCF101]|uniref:DUF938 domain-containing protein n=1 Tax=Synechococcus sp. RSCCF101 TaxID=2511069 RepID=UPI001244983F|nr:DUF938 domain-containing protein [Synechococcus sp. RSCCF101]QEY33196.1 DUF938 domain-containing protein [Synechococcus sp. RSCCF101]